MLLLSALAVRRDPHRTPTALRHTLDTRTCAGRRMGGKRQGRHRCVARPYLIRRPSSAGHEGRRRSSAYVDEYAACQHGMQGALESVEASSGDDAFPVTCSMLTQLRPRLNGRMNE